MSHHGHEYRDDSEIGWQPSTVFAKAPVIKETPKAITQPVSKCNTCEGKGEIQHPHNGDWHRCYYCEGSGNTTLPPVLNQPQPKAIAKKHAPYPLQDKRSVLEIALDIHTTNTGAYERSDADQNKDKEFLTKRLKDWHHQWDLTTKEKASFLRFDEAVRNLVRTVLEEGN